MRVKPGDSVLAPAPGGGRVAYVLAGGDGSAVITPLLHVGPDRPVVRVRTDLLRPIP